MRVRYLNLVNVFKISISKILPQILSFATVLYVAEVYGGNEYGVYSIAISYMVFLSLFSNLGVSDCLLSSSDTHTKDKKRLNSIYKLVSFGIALSLLPLAYFMYPSEALKPIFFVVILEGYARRLEECYFFICQCDEDYNAYTFKKVFFSFFLSITKLCYVTFSKGSIEDFIILSSCVSFLLSVILFSKVIIPFFRVSAFEGFVEYCRCNKKKLWYFSVLSLSYYIYFSSDQLIVGVLASKYDAASYALSFSILQAALIPASSIWAAHISQSSGFNFSKTLMKSFYLGMIISLAVFLFVLFYSVKITNEYNELYFLFYPLCFYLIFRYLNVVFELEITKRNKMKAMVVYRSLGALINVFLNISLIGKFGAFGAAISTLAVESILTLIYYWSVYERK